MNPEVKDRLIEALESDDYAQGKSQLVDTRGEFSYYCCLGVLSELHANDGGCRRSGDSFREPQGEVDTELLGLTLADAEYHGDGIMMPHPQTLTWAGLSAGDANMLATLNDGGANFDAIAQYIKRHL